MLRSNQKEWYHLGNAIVVLIDESYKILTNPNIPESVRNRVNLRMSIILKGTLDIPVYIQNVKNEKRLLKFAGISVDNNMTTDVISIRNAIYSNEHKG